MFDTSIVSLKKLLESKRISHGSIQRALDSFECERDSDITEFLSRRAIPNEKKGFSRTHLVLNSEKIEKDELEVVAFLTIAITATDFSQIDEEERRIILKGAPHISTNTHFPGYLLAQVARDDRYTKDDFDGAILIAEAESMLREAFDIVGGRTVYLDCKEHLKEHYENFGYTALFQDETTRYYKMVKCF